MVFIDTDILSIFSKIQRLPLLFAVFEQDVLNIAAAVENEIKVGVAKGFPFANTIMELQTQGRIQTYYPITEDENFMVSLPDTLDKGERESMAICKRLIALLASNERRVMHHCQANGIHCTNLNEILRALWELRILPMSDVRMVVTEIEVKDSLKFRSSATIFEQPK
ncbi:MAG: hypothetical protein OXI43_09720 [Candidatus Poribacteria bacterium]|nr:hypothetical protein [Candidatus Poribacteria bacterium]